MKNYPVIARFSSICLLSAAALLMAAPPATAQPPWMRDRGGDDQAEGRDRGRGDRPDRGGRGDFRGRDRGDRGDPGDRGGRGDWRGRDRGDRGRPDFGRGGRGGGDDGGGDRQDRFQGWIRSWDADGDGYFTRDEVPERMRGFLDRMAERSGVSTQGRIKVESLISNGTNRGRDSENPMAFGEPTEEKTTPGFDTPLNDDAGTSGFITASQEEIEGARESADDLMRRYDEDRNGVLERDEWTKISGTPANADTNRNGIITRTELINRVIVMKRLRSSSSSSRDSESRDEKSRSGSSRASASASKSGDRRSYRFSTPEERIPDAARSWITSKDKNGDGQVEMHEYTSSWSDRYVSEFSRYDIDGDGVITPQEYLAKK